MDNPSRMHPDDLARILEAFRSPVPAYGSTHLNETDVRRIAAEVAEIATEKIVEKTISRTLESLGVEATTAGFKGYRKKMEWLDDKIELNEKIRSEGANVVIKGAWTAFWGAVVAAGYYWFKNGMPRW